MDPYKTQAGWKSNFLLPLILDIFRDTAPQCIDQNTEQINVTSVKIFLVLISTTI